MPAHFIMNEITNFFAWFSSERFYFDSLEENIRILGVFPFCN